VHVRPQTHDVPAHLWQTRGGIGAAGSFLGTVTEDARVLADLSIEPAQLVVVVGLRSLAAAPAARGGSGTVAASRSKIAGR
jgi:hypothetical protein